MIADLLMHILADDKKEFWEMTRVVAFYVAKFGNSDPKEFPKTLKGFMPFDWDEDGEEEMTLVSEARRLRGKLNELAGNVKDKK